MGDARDDRDLVRRRGHLARQVEHWTSAAMRLTRLEDIAAPEAWRHLEQYLGVALRSYLDGTVTRLVRRGELLRTALASAATGADLDALARQIVAFRRQYLRAETTVDFYADAINTRTNATQGALLRACDTLAHRSMAAILDPLGYDTPVALTYIDKGLGASILKAGLRLWDGGALSPTAAIKVVRHNLQRPTSLVHEAGHQIAHITGWNEHLADALRGIDGGGPIGAVWASWASEIAADAVAFVHTGYGSVLALHDVLAGEPGFVYQVIDGDPHPMSYLRLELGIAMCRISWGDGPWDALATCWRESYPPSRAPVESRALIASSAAVLPAVARLTIATASPAFKGRALAEIVSPGRVSPQALHELEAKLGPALYSSPHWVWTECLRLLALSALHAGDQRRAALPHHSTPESWMLRLGGAQQAA